MDTGFASRRVTCAVGHVNLNQNGAAYAVGAKSDRGRFPSWVGTCPGGEESAERQQSVSLSAFLPHVQTSSVRPMTHIRPQLDTMGNPTKISKTTHASLFIDPFPPDRIHPFARPQSLD